MRIAVHYRPLTGYVAAMTDPAAEAKQAAEYLNALIAAGVPRAEAVDLTKFFISSNRITEAAKPREPKPWES